MRGAPLQQCRRHGTWFRVEDPEKPMEGEGCPACRLEKRVEELERELARRDGDVKGGR